MKIKMIKNAGGGWQLLKTTLVRKELKYTECP